MYHGWSGAGKGFGDDTSVCVWVWVCIGRGVCNKLAASSLPSCSAALSDQSRPFINSWSLSIFPEKKRKKNKTHPSWSFIYNCRCFEVFPRCTEIPIIKTTSQQGAIVHKEGFCLYFHPSLFFLKLTGGWTGMNRDCWTGLRLARVHSMVCFGCIK